MNMRSLMLLVVFAFLAGCSDVSTIPYRTGLAQTGTIVPTGCSISADSDSLHEIDDSATAHDSRGVVYSVDGYEIDRAPPADTAAYACPIQRHKNGSSSYWLGFVEFPKDADAPMSNQVLAMKHLIAQRLQKRRIILVAFVHGWHHDAHLSDENVRGFKLMLSYLDQYRKQRGEAYKNYEVVGLYIGWDGAAGKACSVCVGPGSVWSREKESEHVAAPVVQYLRTISAQLRDMPEGFAGSSQPNKMLVVGHSFGGNILLTGMQSDYAVLIGSKLTTPSHPDSHRPVLRSPIGDLVVLLNPASSAAKWTVLQRQVRVKQGLTDVDLKVENSGEPFDGPTMFSSHQPPILISLTSACISLRRRWATKGGTNYSDCDMATRWLYPMHTLITHPFSGAEQYFTVGHLLPTRTRYLGATHEIDLNGGDSKEVDRETTFAHAANPKSARCEAAPEWLRGFYLKKEPEWDTGDPGIWLDRNAGTNLQVRHQLSQTGYKEKSAPKHITVERDPFWNVRVASGAISSHTVIFSSTIWCGLTQILLDDIAGKDPLTEH